MVSTVLFEPLFHIKTSYMMRNFKTKVKLRSAVFSYVRERENREGKM